jgi:hypothetical protein
VVRSTGDVAIGALLRARLQDGELALRVEARTQTPDQAPGRGAGTPNK